MYHKYVKIALWYSQEIIAIVCRMLLIPFFLREVIAKRKVIIVNYHDPDPECFEKHLKFFSRHYSIIDLDSLADALGKEDFSDLPPKPLIITFDDGHIGNARLLPILKKYNVKSTIYAVAGVVDTKRKFWYKVLSLNSNKIRHCLKQICDDDRRKWLKENCNHTDTKMYQTGDALSEMHLKAYLESGGTIGSHTMFHPILNKCDLSTIRFELEESKALLERKYGIKVNHFAYPNGDWNTHVKDLVIQAGYSTARTLDIGWVTPATDPFTLPNFGISDRGGLNRAVVQASGLWSFIRPKVFLRD